ncbi:MAG: pentapeptide repeat-containing protein [Leptolyngbyaceae bacterium]|nr:pentapeptide repeat-containing protein [Leptolyngbyaceae bacterium]
MQATTQKNKNNKSVVVRAIATPLFLWMVWCFWAVPNRNRETDDGHRTTHESVTLAHLEHEALMGGIGAIATVVAGVALFLSFPATKSNEAATNLSHTDLSGADLSGTDFSNVNLCGATLCNANLGEANLSGADLSGANLNGANLSGANLSGTNLSGANLCEANLSGADLSDANLRYANFSQANFRYANLRYGDLRYANFSSADFHCAFLNRANFSDANLSSALIFSVNLRDTLNLEPRQLKAKPAPFLCHVALPDYSSHPDVNPNRDCDRIPQLLSDRYKISIEEAQGIVSEARQHRWN